MIRRVFLPTESTVSLVCGYVDICALIEAQGVKLKVVFICFVQSPRYEVDWVFYLSRTKPEIEADWGDFQISGF